MYFYFAASFSQHLRYVILLSFRNIRNTNIIIQFCSEIETGTSCTLITLFFIHFFLSIKTFHFYPVCQ